MNILQIKLLKMTFVGTKLRILRRLDWEIKILKRNV